MRKLTSIVLLIVFASSLLACSNSVNLPTNDNSTVLNSGEDTSTGTTFLNPLSPSPKETDPKINSSPETSTEPASAVEIGDGVIVGSWFGGNNDSLALLWIFNNDGTFTKIFTMKSEYASVMNTTVGNYRIRDDIIELYDQTISRVLNDVADEDEPEDDYSFRFEIKLDDQQMEYIVGINEDGTNLFNECLRIS